MEKSIEELMLEFRSGTPGSLEQLMERFYPELKRIASQKMRQESSRHTWQPTVLVNELYLELSKIRELKASEGQLAEDKTQFLSFCAFVMRRLLIHHARPLNKRIEKVTLEPEFEPAVEGAGAMQEIESMMAALEAIDPQIRSVVELRVFGGLSAEEIAERLGCSSRSVTRYWSFARNWLAEHYSSSSNSRAQCSGS